MKHGPTNTRFIKEFRKHLSLSQIQKEILVGTLLGDGHLESSRSSVLARFKVRHTALFLEYINWIYGFWKPWTLKIPAYDSCNNSYILRTIYHSELANWRKLFYEGKQKIIPNTINNLLKTPLSLAVWFMDDGNGAKGRAWLRLSTYAFGLSGNLVLQNCLMRNFGLEAKIYHDSKGNYLWFGKSTALKLYFLLKPYILPCMKYKFNTFASLSLTP